MGASTRLFHSCISCNREDINKPSFFRARLSVEYNPDRYPSIFSRDRTYILDGNSRRYLRINIKNASIMSKVAENCKATLMVIPSNNAIQHPTIERVRLAWEGTSNDVNLKTSTDGRIQSGDTALLHVIFSDSTFSTISVRPLTPIHAVISSKEALDAFHPRIIEHGFTVGDFKIEIAITSDNSRLHKSYFRVHVGNQWDRLSMNKLSWFEGLVARLRSWRHSR